MIKLWFDNGAWTSKRGRKALLKMSPETVQRIAVIRHAALGDMVLTRPFLTELRRYFPNAFITLSVVSNYTRGMPEDLVDAVHIAYGSDQRNVPKLQQLRKLRELGDQDLIFDLAATARSFWICALNKAKVKLGFPYRALQRYLFYDVTVLRSELRFEAEAMLDMLNLMGFKTAFPLDFGLPGKRNESKQPYILYFTGASTPLKCWPKVLFQELIINLVNGGFSLEHYVLGGRAEWESNMQMLEALQVYPSVKEVVADSVEETVALIKGASLVVSNDTGIRNLAIAAGVKTVGIFFESDNYIPKPFRYWPRDGKHEIVLNPDGSIPAPTQVAEAVNASLEADG